MAILDFLIGRGGLDRQRRHADEYAEAMYDTSQFRPVLSEAQTQATQGIGAQADQMRTGLISQLTRDDVDPSRLGGQAQALGFLSERDAGRSRALAEGELQIGMADTQAKQEGRSRVSQILSQIQQTKQQREAALAENRMKIEAEAGRRRQGLLGAAIGVGSTLLGGPIGGALGSQISGLFNRGSEQPTSAIEVPRTNAPQVGSIQARDISHGSQEAWRGARIDRMFDDLLLDRGY